MGCTFSRCRHCGMRRPTLVQHEDDLSRLTSTSSSTSTSTTPPSTNGTLKTGNGSAAQPTAKVVPNGGSYLPANLVNSVEWQNCRKRKERQDSTSSITQDHKLVRSNSEEHVPNCSEVIRRVSSHEDFNKKPPPLHLNQNANIIQEGSEPPEVKSEQIEEAHSRVNTHLPKQSDRLSPHRDQRHLSRRGGDIEDSEQRRNSERFSHTRAPLPRKSPSPRRSHKSSAQAKSSPAVHAPDEPDKAPEKEDESVVEPQQPPREPRPWDHSFVAEEAPVVCQRFANHRFDPDLSEKFSKQLATDQERRSSPAATAKYHLAKAANDPASPVTNIFQTPDERIKQINKRLASLKRRIANYEENFERENGYRPSQAEKLNDRAMKNAVAEIHKLRKEKSQIRADPITAMGYRTVSSAGVPADKKVDRMKETLDEIEKRLTEKRREDNRPDNIEDLSPEELIEEKTAIQRGLLYLESLFGRPSSREERDAARPLYDRYRLIKRLVNRNNSLSGGGLVVPELPTILENEALAFTAGTPSNDLSPPSAVQSPESSASLSAPDSTDSGGEEPVLGGGGGGPRDENVQLMPIEQLWNQLDAAREEKKQLRRSLKEFEYNFEEKNGRKMLKSDRRAMEETYALYKQKKAKLRLLDALVKKQMNN